MITTDDVEKMALTINGLIRDGETRRRRGMRIFRYLMKELPGAKKRFADFGGPTPKIRDWAGKKKR